MFFFSIYCIHFVFVFVFFKGLPIIIKFQNLNFDFKKCPIIEYLFMYLHISNLKERNFQFCHCLNGQYFKLCDDWIKLSLFLSIYFIPKYKQPLSSFKHRRSLETLILSNWRLWRRSVGFTNK